MSLNNFEAIGYPDYFTERFQKKGEYFLIYGSEKAARLKYDLKYISRIPKDFKSINLQSEQQWKRVKSKTESTFWQNKILLWSIILTTVGILSWFSLKMIKENSLRK